MRKMRRIMQRRREGDSDAEERSALSPAAAHDDSSFDSNDFQPRRASTEGRNVIAKLFRSLPTRIRRQHGRFGRPNRFSGHTGTVQTSPFQWNYWRNLRQIDIPSSCWFRAPSSVKEIAYYAGCNWTVMICSGGDIVALVNDPVTPRVAWSGRVLMTGLDGSVAASASVRLKRATFDPATERIYFTQSNHAGIFYARLNEIRNTVVHQPETFLTRWKTRDHFSAIAVDSRQNILICCNSNKTRPSITFWSTAELSGSEMVPLAEIPCSGLLTQQSVQPELRTIRPHKCATFGLSEATGCSTLVAIADKANSGLYLFRLSSQQGVVKFEYFATAATANARSDFRRPRAVHFDPAGNLIVADDGPLHSRLQVFSPTERGSYEPDVDQLLSTSIYRSVFAPIKCMAVSIDPSTRRPFILCGISGFVHFPGIRRIGTSGEIACFCYEE